MTRLPDPADRRLTNCTGSAANGHSGDSGSSAIRLLRERLADTQDYIEAISSRRIVSQTSSECLKKLGKLSLRFRPGNEQIDILKHCFKRCDMAKFAHAAPDSRETAALGEMAESFIAATRMTRGRTEHAAAAPRISLAAGPAAAAGPAERPARSRACPAVLVNSVASAMAADAGPPSARC